MLEFVFVFLAVLSSIMAHWGVIVLLVQKRGAPLKGDHLLTSYILPSAILTSFLVALLSVL